VPKLHESPVQLGAAASEPFDMNDHPLSELQVDELTCIECERSWIVPLERWRLYLTDEPLPEAVLYCADCAEREFGR
jgi:hypothetical protein